VSFRTHTQKGSFVRDYNINIGFVHSNSTHTQIHTLENDKFLLILIDDVTLLCDLIEHEH
jgi:hypothetical protein